MTENEESKKYEGLRVVNIAKTEVLLPGMEPLELSGKDIEERGIYKAMLDELERRMLEKGWLSDYRD